MGKRRRAREMAMQMLYQHELGGSPLPKIFSSFDLKGYLEETEVSLAAGRPAGGRPAGGRPAGGRPAAVDSERLKLAERSFEYARRLVEGTVENRATIDSLIRRHAENWRLERMPTIDRNILRLAIYEMLHEANVPKVVIVDEAIELAKKFGSENSGRFINGLLDGVLQSRRLSAPVASGTV